MDSDYMREDLRYRRALHLSASLLEEIEHLITPDSKREIHEALVDALFRNGAWSITDRERDRLGLEPRDEKGWTPSERVALKQAKIDAMLAMASMVCPLPTAPR